MTVNVNEQMIQALRQFSEATSTITKLWESVDLNALDAIDKYPFQRSFNEYEYDIENWVDETIEELSLLATAAPHNKLAETLRNMGLDASVVRLEGENAINVQLKNGHSYNLYIAGEDASQVSLAEFDEDGEYLEKTTMIFFDSHQEVFDHLFASDQVTVNLEVLKLGTEMREIPIDTGERVGSINLGRENVLRMKALVDEALSHNKLADEVENLKTMKVALNDHVIEYLDFQANTGDYSHKFDLKITIGNRTFDLPLGAQLVADFDRMLQTEIDDLEG